MQDTVSDVFEKTLNQYVSVLCCLFQMKRSKLHEQMVDLDLTWKKIVTFLNEKLEKSEMQSVNEDLKDILQSAKQIGIVLFIFFLLRFLLTHILYIIRLKFSGICS